MARKGESEQISVSDETAEAMRSAINLVGKTVFKAIFSLYNTTEVLLRARNPELSKELAEEKEKFLAEYGCILAENEEEG